MAESVTPLLRRTGVPPRIGSIQPHAVREFWSDDVQYVVEREILRHSIDIVQIEYTNMGQYLATAAGTWPGFSSSTISTFSLSRPACSHCTEVHA